MATSVTEYKYQFASGSNCRIRLKKETELEKAYGAQPTTGTDFGFLLVQSKNKKEGGIHARYGVWRATITTGDFENYIYKNWPILTIAHATTLQTSAGSTNPQTLTYKGLTWIIKRVGKQDPEIIVQEPEPNP